MIRWWVHVLRVIRNEGSFELLTLGRRIQGRGIADLVGSRWRRRRVASILHLSAALAHVIPRLVILDGTLGRHRLGRYHLILT